jgi:hypothetical protein
VRGREVAAKEPIMFQSVLVRDRWLTSACTHVAFGFVVVLHVLPMALLETFAFIG